MTKWIAAWVAWIVAFLGWTLLAPALDHHSFIWGLRALFVIFGPLEYFGFRTSNYFGPGPEKIQTLSQVMQALAARGVWFRLFAACFAVMVSAGAVVAWWDASPWLAVPFGLGVLAVTLGHWLWREERTP